jgi:hypothetical protein
MERLIQPRVHQSCVHVAQDGGSTQAGRATDGQRPDKGEEGHERRLHMYDMGRACSGEDATHVDDRMPDVGDREHSTSTNGSPRRVQEAKVEPRCKLGIVHDGLGEGGDAALSG